MYEKKQSGQENPLVTDKTEMDISKGARRRVKVRKGIKRKLKSELNKNTSAPSTSGQISSTNPKEVISTKESIPERDRKQLVGPREDDFNKAMRYYNSESGLEKNKAYPLFLEAAQNGHVAALFYLGLCHEFSLGIYKDEIRAVKRFREAGDKGCAEAQYHLGLCYEKGTCGVTINNDEAVKLFKNAANNGHAEAQYHLGLCYEKGTCGVTINNDEAVKLFKNSANNGHAEAQYNLGYCYQNGEGDFPEDEKEAAKWYQKAAEQNYPQAQFLLGVCYMHGSCNFLKNEEEAFKWYRRAAKNNNAEAQYFLGSCYEYGECGVKKSAKKAIGWYRKAAEQGYAEAQTHLGLCYQDGKCGIKKKDAKEAVRWYLMAARQNYAEAQFFLGQQYEEEGREDAIKWIRVAASQEHVEAQLHLAEHYEHAKEIEEAVKWYQWAAENGSEEARNKLIEYKQFIDTRKKEEPIDSMASLYSETERWDVKMESGSASFSSGASSSSHSISSFSEISSSLSSTSSTESMAQPLYKSHKDPSVPKDEFDSSSRLKLKNQRGREKENTRLQETASPSDIKATKIQILSSQEVVEQLKKLGTSGKPVAFLQEQSKETNTVLLIVYGLTSDQKYQGYRYNITLMESGNWIRWIPQKNSSLLTFRQTEKEQGDMRTQDAQNKLSKYVHEELPKIAKECGFIETPTLYFPQDTDVTMEKDPSAYRV